MSLPSAVANLLDDIFGDEWPAAVGVAVSGGGDSVALLHMVHRWGAARGVRVLAATVDHGLRVGSAAEAATVAAACRALKVDHDTLRWQGWDGSGNLPAAARQARRGLLTDWALSRGLNDLIQGHTADDQAETVLMRLARGSGVDGLSGMEQVSRNRINLLRPLLGLRRADLRGWLTAEGIGWVEDPSNEDPRFDRVRVRQAMAALDLRAERLLRTADHMRRARWTLQVAAAALAQAEVVQDRGDLTLTTRLLTLDHEDSPGRVLSGAFRWIGGNDYRPDWDALCAAADRLRGGQAVTLAGVVARPAAQAPGCVRLSREPARVAPPVAIGNERAIGATWDRRWIVERRDGGPFGPGSTLRALAEDGLARCPDWRATGLPRDSLLASPSVWQGASLLAAPLAAPGGDWTARIALDFVSFLKSD